MSRRGQLRPSGTPGLGRVCWEEKIAPEEERAKGGLRWVPDELKPARGVCGWWVGAKRKIEG